MTDDDATTDEADGVAGMMKIIESLGPIREGVLGYRAQLIEGDMPPDAASLCAVQLHQLFMSLLSEDQLNRVRLEHAKAVAAADLIGAVSDAIGGKGRRRRD